MDGFPRDPQLAASKTRSAAYGKPWSVLTAARGVQGLPVPLLHPAQVLPVPEGRHLQGMVTQAQGGADTQAKKPASPTPLGNVGPTGHWQWSRSNGSSAPWVFHPLIP